MADILARYDNEAAALRERSEVMRESVKAICSLVLIVASVVAAVAWNANRPGAVTWALRIGGPIAAVLALGTILKLQFREHLAPDYLHESAGDYFNRDGFCFAVSAAKSDGVAYLEAYFQNQRDRPCVVRIALRPARGFFLGRAKIDIVTFEIDSAPAAFGVARIPIPVPQGLQGTRQSFEVGASVDHPRGKGRTLRFRDGTLLRSDPNFRDQVGTALAVAGAVSGAMVLSKPAKVTVELPYGVADDVSNALAPQVETLWQLGDAPLEKLA